MKKDFGKNKLITHNLLKFDRNIFSLSGGSFFICDENGDNIVQKKIIKGAFNDMISLNDGNIVLIGTIEKIYYKGSKKHHGWTDLIIVKIDKKGNKIGERVLGSGIWEEGISISELSDGSFIAIGYYRDERILKDGGLLSLKLNKEGKLSFTTKLLRFFPSIFEKISGKVPVFD